MGKFQLPLTIYETMEKIRTKEYVLPSFQREFEWEADDICKLFDSILRGYPVGSMLFWKIDQKIANDIKVYNFNDNCIENSDRVVNSPCKQNICNQFADNIIAILDGQQRLTALRIGIYGKYYEHQKNKSWDYNKQTFDEKYLYLRLKENKNFEEDDRKFIFKFIKHTGIVYVENGIKWFRVYDIVNYYKEYNKTYVEIGTYYRKFKLNSQEKQIINLLKAKIFEEDEVNYYLEIQAIQILQCVFLPELIMMGLNYQT